jgi:class 3 adenylate cyclase
LVTILFTEIVQSTERSTTLGPRAWRTLSDAHDTVVRAALGRHRGREIKTIGDGFLAIFDSSTSAVRCAAEISREATALGHPVRAGLHIGEVEVRDGDGSGLVVTIATRICDLTGPGQVLVSESMRGLLVGSPFEMTVEGTHVLKGVPDEWRLGAAHA